MNAIVSRDTNITIARASLSGYGKVCIHDKGLASYIGKKLRIKIEVYEGE